MTDRNLGRMNETGVRFRYDYAVQTIQVLRVLSRGGAYRD